MRPSFEQRREDYANFVEAVQALFLKGTEQTHLRTGSLTGDKSYTQGQTELIFHPEPRNFLIQNLSDGKPLEFKIERSNQGQGLKGFMDANPDIFGYVNGSLSLNLDHVLDESGFREVSYKQKVGDHRVLYCFVSDRYPRDECIRAVIKPGQGSKDSLVSMFFSYEPVDLDDLEVPDFPSAIDSLVSSRKGLNLSYEAAKNCRVVGNPELIVLHLPRGFEFAQEYKVVLQGKSSVATLYLNKDRVVALKQNAPM